jgi:hypothetical protein
VVGAGGGGATQVEVVSGGGAWVSGGGATQVEVVGTGTSLEQLLVRVRVVAVVT